MTNSKAQEPLHNWDQTNAACVIPAELALQMQILPKKFARCSSFHVQNGEECKVNDWVIVKANNRYFYVAKVTEILQIPGFEAELLQQPNFVLILLHSASYEVAEYYKMPKLSNLGVYELAVFLVRVFDEVWSFVSEPLQNIVCVANVQHNC